MPEKPTDKNMLQRLTRENQERRAAIRAMRYRGQRRYWQLFNIAGRFGGIWFLVVGGMLFLWTLTQNDWLAICFTALGPVFGILLLCAKPYRPDLPEDDKKDL
jgi:hypothetical protein